MELVYTKEKIQFEKELNSLDQFVIDFCSVLNRLNVTYVIVSGYVAILFGRNRTSEDVDILIEEVDEESFTTVWKELNTQFECLNTSNRKSAYTEYFKKKTAIRFSRKKEYIPNMEVKCAQNETERWVLTERRKIEVNGNTLFLSPIETQIAFKVFLGSEKDLEDARYLYRIFKEHIDKSAMETWKQKLKIQEQFKEFVE